MQTSAALLPGPTSFGSECFDERHEVALADVPSPLSRHNNSSSPRTSSFLHRGELTLRSVRSGALQPHPAWNQLQALLHQQGVLPAQGLRPRSALDLGDDPRAQGVPRRQGTLSLIYPSFIPCTTTSHPFSTPDTPYTERDSFRYLHPRRSDEDLEAASLESPFSPPCTPFPANVAYTLGFPIHSELLRETCARLTFWATSPCRCFVACVTP